jgi:hypothetical protein
MPPYGEFLVEFERRHRHRTHANDPRNVRAALIVESRTSFFLPKVIRTVMFYLGPSWNLYVLTSHPTAPWLRSQLPGWEVPIVPVVEPVRMPRELYNAWLLHETFWRQFREEQLLVFQTDSLLCGPNIGDFLDYDLAGAPCRRFDEEYVANGGLSLRRRELLLDCLAATAPEPGEPEDAYFTRAMRALGAKLPDFTTATRFSVETTYTGHPVGVHGTDQYWHGLEVARAVVDAARF